MGAKPPEIAEVDPSRLRLPWSRKDGADPMKFMRQISRYGSPISTMPRPFVYRGTDDELILADGVTRATRVAKLLPGVTIEVEVIGKMRMAGSLLPRVGERLP